MSDGLERLGCFVFFFKSLRFGPIEHLIDTSTFCSRFRDCSNIDNVANNFTTKEVLLLNDII